MYIRGGIRTRHLLRDSWRFLLLAALWSAVIIYLHDIRGYAFIAVPMAPISVLGIAVALYLGFKSKEAYSRWWEARILWGDVVGSSRTWGYKTSDLLHKDSRPADPALRRELVERHLAWLYALVHQLRAATRLRESSVTRIFGHSRRLDHASLPDHQARSIAFLSETDAAAVAGTRNPAVQILARQSERLRELANENLIDSYRHVSLIETVEACVRLTGGLERLKNTPFPRQIANFGQLFTWTFIALLPVALIDTFEAETRFHEMGEILAHEYMFTLLPFSVLISWIFFVMEKVSDSVEDPFEGGVTDVPIATIARTIEIDLLQMLDTPADDVPAPLQPIDGVLY